MPGRIRNASGRGMGLAVAQPIGVGALLQIAADSLLPGEVIDCRMDGDGFYVGVEREQALHGLAELAEMVRQYAEEILRRRACRRRG